MGVKEEELTMRLVYGYYGQTKPTQVNAGKCNNCQQDVWVDAPANDGKQYRGSIFAHYSCAMKVWREVHANNTGRKAGP